MGPIGPKGPRCTDGGQRRAGGQRRRTAAGGRAAGGWQAEAPEHTSEGAAAQASQISQLP